MTAHEALLQPATWSLWALVAALAGSAVAIIVLGTLLTRQADRLADRTGWGEAIFGAVVLGASTSLAGSVMSVAVAWQGFPGLAAANAVGGIAAQTAFLVVADVTYRRANLEHAAASLENLLLGALLCIMLALPLAATATPDVTLLGIHPATLVLFGAYLLGLRVVRNARTTPLWYPRRTLETREDEGRDTSGVRTPTLWTAFTVLAVATAAAGLLVAQSAIGLVQRTGVGETLVGAYITAIITSLPELVITLAAVRRGALTLAVGGIIGGNSFDVLFLAFSDVAYRAGSIYHAVGDGVLLLLGVDIVMTGVLLLGLLRREPAGFAGIGFESITLLLLYLGVTAVLFVAP